MSQHTYTVRMFYCPLHFQPLFTWPSEPRVLAQKDYYKMQTNVPFSPHNFFSSPLCPLSTLLYHLFTSLPPLQICSNLFRSERSNASKGPNLPNPSPPRQLSYFSSSFNIVSFQTFLCSSLNREQEVDRPRSTSKKRFDPEILSITSLGAYGVPDFS